MIDLRVEIERFDVEPAKLAEYLLNPAHLRGRAKAARFLRHRFTAEVL